MSNLIYENSCKGIDNAAISSSDYRDRHREVIGLLSEDKGSTTKRRLKLMVDNYDVNLMRLNSASALFIAVACLCLYFSASNRKSKELLLLQNCACKAPGGARKPLTLIVSVSNYTLCTTRFVMNIHWLLQCVLFLIRAF
jgi:hypothetical protein